MRLFDIVKWMRITYFESSTFCVELKGTFLDKLNGDGDRMRAMLRFAQDYRNFDVYCLNDARFETFLDFVRAIRSNDVQPTNGLVNEEE